jgi:ribosome maturation factor RimP
MISAKVITDLVNTHLEATEMFLVGVHISANDEITVTIDSDTSVTVDDCADLSRFIEKHLDRDKEDFGLCVTSAGLDHPLLLPRQFMKNIGSDVVVLLKSGAKHAGVLQSFEDGRIVVSAIPGKKKAGELQTFLPEEIKSVKLGVSMKKTDKH